MHKRLSTFCQVVLWSPFWPSLFNAKCKDFICIMKNYLLTLNTIDENCKTFSSEATNAAAMHQKRPKLLLLLVYSARGDGCTTSLTVGKKVLPPLQLYPNLLSTSALFSLRKGHNYLSSVKNQRRGFTGALPIFFFRFISRGIKAHTLKSWRLWPFKVRAYLTP